jgi:hypothetical protein
MSPVNSLISMKKLTSLLIFVGLAINVSGQEEPKNLKEAMDVAKAHWLIGDWERTRSNGTKQQVSYRWAVKDGVISFQVSQGGETTIQGVIGFDSISGKVVGKNMGRGGGVDSEWAVIEGKLIETVKGSRKNQEGEITSISTARFHRKVDENTMEQIHYRVTESGETGEAWKREDGTIYVQTFKRKK